MRKHQDFISSSSEMPRLSQTFLAGQRRGSLSLTWTTATAPQRASLSRRVPHPCFLCVISLKNKQTYSWHSTVWLSPVGDSLLSAVACGVRPNSQEKQISTTIGLLPSATSPLPPPLPDVMLQPHWISLQSSSGRCFPVLCFSNVSFSRMLIFYLPRKTPFILQHKAQMLPPMGTFCNFSMKFVSSLVLLFPISLLQHFSHYITIIC